MYFIAHCTYVIILLKMLDIPNSVWLALPPPLLPTRYITALCWAINVYSCTNLTFLDDNSCHVNYVSEVLSTAK